MWTLRLLPAVNALLHPSNRTHTQAKYYYRSPIKQPCTSRTLIILHLRSASQRSVGKSSGKKTIFGWGDELEKYISYCNFRLKHLGLLKFWGGIVFHLIWIIKEWSKDYCVLTMLLLLNSSCQISPTLNWTNIRFFPCMNKLVSLQMTWSGEGFTAALIITHKRPFTGVFPHMPLQFVSACEWPTTPLL